jgi:hypothetical protein
MAEFTSILPGITSALGAATRFAGTINAGGGNRELRRQQELALQQLNQRNAFEEEQAQKKRDRDLMMLQAEAGESERRRASALKRSVSRQRALFGGAGVDPEDGGSAEAVLLGLFEESDAERQSREQLDQLRRAVIDDSFDGLKGRNLLETSQLAARQQLQSRLA